MPVVGASPPVSARKPRFKSRRRALRRIIGSWMEHLACGLISDRHLCLLEQPKASRTAATKLPWTSHRFGRSAEDHSRRVAWRGSGAVLSDLQGKLEKYERKAAEYGRAAEKATDGPQRAFYEGLAHHCDELATKFREVIAKRSEASLAAE